VFIIFSESVNKIDSLILRVLLFDRIFCVEAKIRNGGKRAEARHNSITDKAVKKLLIALDERANKQNMTAGVDEPAMKRMRFEATSNGSSSARFSDDRERQVSNPGSVAHCGIKPSLRLGRGGEMVGLGSSRKTGKGMVEDGLGRVGEIVGLGSSSKTGKGMVEDGSSSKVGAGMVGLGSSRVEQVCERSKRNSRGLLYWEKLCPFSWQLRVVESGCSTPFIPGSFISMFFKSIGRHWISPNSWSHS
jgi:hypothetical protein